ncbi:mechanosensitive ion channel family protein, partial [Fulvivirga sp. RKSG066]|uniref:mechanosensitive ion channel family protein n=1 Tax=Fulvivirga aurantia TaxID=2529383 RepID=UPI0012BCE046
TAIIVIILFYFLARWIGKIIVKIYKKRDRSNLGRMLGGLGKYIVLALGIMFGLTIVIPKLNPGDLIAGLGVSSVAIGFAFKDILQNWLAGLLILIRQPFEIKDQIEVNDFEGTVETIETRATIIKTYAGERIVIPNSEIYTNAVKVKTAHEKRRSQYDVGIGYADDIDKASEVIKEALNKVDGIDKEHGVEVLPWGLDASWVTLRVRWWTKSDRASVVKVMMQVIKTLKLTLDDAKIDMPYETQVLLFHDQTEDVDGDRSKQREGWPAESENGSTPKWKALENK